MDTYNQKLPVLRDELSLVPFSISMYFEDTKMSVGTAFFYLYEDEFYLVTNWHNVTGREPVTLKCKHSYAGLPNRLLINIPHSIHENQVARTNWKEHSISLYEDIGDAPTKPRWYEHPTHKNKVDLVAIPMDMNRIPIDSLEIISSRAANDPSLNLNQICLSPGLDVFVLGFPMGINGGGDFPIWKRGSIASEPDFDIDGLPKIYIDTATREGISGSPVYAQETGYWFPENATTQNEAKLGKGRRFLGVYSGRVGADSFLAQLGIVWKSSAIEEILQDKVTGISSFELCEICI